MRAKLEILERVVVIVAAIVAIFPLWQWWSERDARDLDRIANLATAGALCRERAIDLGGYTTPSQALNNYGGVLLEMFRLAGEGGIAPSDTDAIRKRQQYLQNRRQAFAEEYAGFEIAMDEICDEALTAVGVSESD